MSRLGLIIVSAVVITIVILANTLYIVTDRETAIKLRFGEIIDSSIEPGLHFKVPILHTIKKFDERVLTLDNLPQPYFTAEKKRLIVIILLNGESQMMSNSISPHQAANFLL